jgi:hypothetical protein
MLIAVALVRGAPHADAESLERDRQQPRGNRGHSHRHRRLRGVPRRHPPLASLLFAALWLTATTMLIKPNSGRRDRVGRRPRGLHRRKGTERSQEEAAPATR